MTVVTQRPVVFLLHALGASARSFDAVAAKLGDGFECIALDLPGFGGASLAAGTGVEAMAGVVIEAIRRRGPSRWLLVGHSMGGKIATVVASRVLAGEPGVFGLAGVMLLAGSPPSPEPMDEARRAHMLAWAEQGPLNTAAAREFIDGNTGSPLAPEADARALADLQRTAPQAWRAWLERGSREDWSAFVGSLALPARVLVGSEDGDLGEAGQRATNLCVYPRAGLVVLPGAGHLLPLERSEAVAGQISRFWLDEAGTGPTVDEVFARLVASDRVSRRTRAILARRALADAGLSPRLLNPAQLATLRAIADRTVPQEGPRIDLALRLDGQLAENLGDGWRFAALPPDAQACGEALDGLAGFEDSDPDRQDERLAEIAAGRFAARGSELSPTQWELWFEDLRADLVRLWMAHPATMARIGFDGIATGGDGTRLQGFDLLGADEHEAWEPVA